MMKKVDINEVIIEITERASHLPGWEIHRHGSAVVMCTPTSAPQLNLCISPQNKGDLDFATKIFKDRTFGVIHDTPLDIPEDYEETASFPMTQMYLDLGQSKRYEEEPMVEQITTREGLGEWAKVYGEIVQFDADSAYAYLLPFLDKPESEVYGIFKDGTLIATGNLYKSKTNQVQITSIAVREDYRRQGIGSKIMRHALARAQSLGATMAVLHASEMGEYLYKAENFQTSHSERFSFLKPRASQS